MREIIFSGTYKPILLFQSVFFYLVVSQGGFFILIFTVRECSSRQKKEKGMGKSLKRYSENNHPGTFIIDVSFLLYSILSPL
jgi:hypothetical protein